MQGWACERVLLSDAFQGRLLMVLPSDPASHVKKVRVPAAGSFPYAIMALNGCLGADGLDGCMLPAVLPLLNAHARVPQAP